MAYSVRQERQGLATSLRDDLAEAERLIVQLRRDNVEAFLQLMDRIEESFTLLETSGLDLRPERTRWGSLLSKLTREAGRVVRTIDVAGGLGQLRKANPPAEGLWWKLDAVVAAARRRLIRRLGITVGTIAAVLAVIWALLTYVFPPDPNTVVASEAITTLQQLSFEERWEDALTTIEEAKAQLTQPDAELLIWEGGRSRQTGAERALAGGSGGGQGVGARRSASGISVVARRHPAVRQRSGGSAHRRQPSGFIGTLQSTRLLSLGQRSRIGRRHRRRRRPLRGSIPTGFGEQSPVSRDCPRTHGQPASTACQYVALRRGPARSRRRRRE